MPSPRKPASSFRYQLLANGDRAGADDVRFLPAQPLERRGSSVQAPARPSKVRPASTDMIEQDDAEGALKVLIARAQRRAFKFSASSNQYQL
jgi:hypothetical protein